MEFFNEKLEKNKQKTKEKYEIKQELNFSYENIVEPSKDLFDYINQNYKLNLVYNENENSKED